MNAKPWFFGKRIEPLASAIAGAIAIAIAIAGGSVFPLPASAATPPKPAPGSARILKVLPHFLDRQGRHTTNPSLFDRDAYQFELRNNPDLRSGMRFDVLWKGIPRAPSAILTLKLELRGSKAQSQAPVVVTQRVFASAGFSKWTRLPLVGPDYEALGELSAWRASLWRDNELVAEQTSFLW